jgi:hypothetical protein
MAEIEELSDGSSVSAIDATAVRREVEAILVPSEGLRH